MKDRFLSRALRLDNGEPVEGYYFGAPAGYFIREVGDGMFYTDEVHAVNAATIDQCTGIRDGSGTLIFENDILRHEKHGICSHYSVVWNDDRWLLERYVPFGGEDGCGGPGHPGFKFPPACERRHVKVVGNLRETKNQRHGRRQTNFGATTE